MSTDRKQFAWRVCQKGKAVQGLASPSHNPFIIATNEDGIKPDARSRKFIRHHVMKGRKRKRVSSQNLELGSWINHEHDTSQLAVKNDLTRQGRLPNPLNRLLNEPSSCHVGFPVDVEPCKLQLLCEFITIMNKEMYPIGSCVDLAKEGHHWFANLSYDPAYAHVVLYTAQTYFDIVKCQVFGPKAIMHMNRNMRLLRKTLAEPNEAITDSTIFTVMALAMASEVFGDLETAKKHLRGLCEIISVRGGIQTLSQNRSLQVKCCRLDLRISLKSGSNPFLFSDKDLSWRTYLVDSQKTSAKTPVHTMCEATDVRLVNVWLDLREFTIAVNLAHQTKRTISADLFQEALISVQYRLQHLAYESHDLHETLRLGMLALSTTLFLKADGSELHCRHLAERLRVAIKSLNGNGNQEWLRLSLWLIFVGRVSLLDNQEDSSWLNQRLLITSQALELKTWNEIRLILKSFLWVDTIHDEAGKMFLQQVKSLRRSKCVLYTK